MLYNYFVFEAWRICKWTSHSSAAPERRKPSLEYGKIRKQIDWHARDVPRIQGIRIGEYVQMIAGFPVAYIENQTLTYSYHIQRVNNFECHFFIFDAHTLTLTAF